MLVLEAAHKNKERSLFVLSLLCLVAFQGVLGWVMVRSGLRDVAMVSPYLLTLHLFLALVLVLVVVRRLFRENFWDRRLSVSFSVRVACFSVACVSVLTFLMGGFVAGLRGGEVHNDWPLMSGDLLPSDYFVFESFWRNAFENPSAVQFEHRFLAFFLLLGCFGLFWKFRRSYCADVHVRLLFFLPLFQVFLGGLSLRLHVPVFLGILHHLLGVVVVIVLFLLFWRSVASAS